MDKNPQPSFIPRQNPANRPSVARRKRFNLLGFLSVIIFLGSVVLGVGAFIYDKYESAELGSIQQKLNDEKGQFKFDILDEIRATDNRLKTAKTLVDGHVSPSKLFDVLERSTQEDIQYTAMSFVRRPSGDLSVILTGLTSSFNSVALQAERFRLENVLKDGSVIFTGINKSLEGEVNFTVTLDIPKAALAFEGMLPEAGIEGEPVVEELSSETDGEEVPVEDNEVEQ